MPQVPYLIYGTIKKNGIPQANEDVTIKNVTKNEQYTIKTTSAGGYTINLGDTTKFPSGYAENDVIRVTALTVYAETTVTGTGLVPPTMGKRVDIVLWEINVSDSLSLSDVALRSQTLTVTDSLGLTDEVARSLMLQILDSVGLIDSVLRNKTLSTADSLSLVDSILTSKQLSLTDAVSLFDAVLRNKTFTVTDLMNLTEAVELITGAIIQYVADTITTYDTVKTTTRILKALESIGLSDRTITIKTLQISDNISLAEVVSAWSLAIKKTKLCLIIGNLAINLKTGEVEVVL